MLNPAPLIHPILSIGDVRGGDLLLSNTYLIQYLSLSISGDVRGGDVHGERAVQERGARSLQQKSRLREPFPGGLEYFSVG